MYNADPRIDQSKIDVDAKCDLTRQHVYDAHFGQGRGNYAEAI